MHRILISSCLLGEPVRYNGAHKLVEDPLLARWRAEGRLVPFCPELAGGLAVPRPPAEIQGPGGGLAVLQGQARVTDPHNNDLTAHFLEGAHQALALARLHNIRLAILTDRSPSCGSTTIHDGSFSSALRPGLDGVAAALLRAHGLALFSQHQLPDAAAFLQNLEAPPGA